MSLITDALQKAQSPSSGDRPAGSPPAPPWWPAGLLLGALAFLGLWVWHAAPGRWTHRPAPRAAMAAAPATGTAKPRALKPILALLPGAPSSPSLTWRIDGVVTGMGTPLAIINGKTVAEGEEVSGGTKVVRVDQERVQLQHDNGEVVTVPVESER